VNQVVEGTQPIILEEDICITVVRDRFHLGVHNTSNGKVNKIILEVVDVTITKDLHYSILDILS
jgi:hypothetical protein